MSHRIARVIVRSLGAASVALACTVAPAAAQQGGHGEHGQVKGHEKADSSRGMGMGAARGMRGADGEFKLPKLFDGITLTEHQRHQVHEVMTTHHAAMDSVRNAARAAGTRPMDDEATMAKLRVMMDREHAAFRALLTPEQQVTFDKNLAEHMKEEHGPGRGRGRP
jgi:Spy/CpxP family protein refolding chaperone